MPACRCEVGQLISEDGQVRFYRGLYHGNPVVLKVMTLPLPACLPCPLAAERCTKSTANAALLPQIAPSIQN